LVLRAHESAGLFTLEVTMAIFKKNDNYYIDYYFEGRRIREKVGPSHKQAQAALNARKGEIAQGKFELKGTKASPVFRDYAKRYLEWSKGNKRSWVRDRVSIVSLSRDFARTRLNAINSWSIEQYKLSRAKSVKKATVNRELACLKHMFTKAIERGLLDENPAKNVKLYKENNQRVRRLKPTEEERLLKACSPHIRPIIIMALHTGMRQGEIFSLMWDHIDFKNKFIAVVDSKNKEPRWISMTRTLTNLLQEIKIDSLSSYVFSHQVGQEHRRYKTIRKPWLKAIEEAKIKDFRFHDLRHTFASRLVMAGIDLVTVKELLGHKSIDMTMRYAHLSQDHKRKAIAVLDGQYMDTDAVNQETEEAVTQRVS
jgi:integrase